MDHTAYSIGTDASFNANKMGPAAFVVYRLGASIYKVVHPYPANSSFDGEMAALFDAVDYLLQHLHGTLLLITDNVAALQKMLDASPHSGFCKFLKSSMHGFSGQMIMLFNLDGY